MTHIKSYIKWLSDKAYLNKLVPADVPRGKVVGKMPAYLSKNDLTKLFTYLEQLVSEANKNEDKHIIYYAYLWRAVARMLYTT